MNQAAMIERIENLIREQGSSPTPFQKELGLSRSFFSDAKKSNTTKLDNIVLIAEALNVSIDFLVYGEERRKEVVHTYTLADANPEFAKLYALYSGLSERDKGKVEGYIQGLSENCSKEENTRQLLLG